MEAYRNRVRTDAPTGRDGFPARWLPIKGLRGDFPPPRSGEGFPRQPKKGPHHGDGRHAPEPPPLVNPFVKSAQLLSSHVKFCQAMSSHVKDSLDSILYDINELAQNELTNAASAMS